MWNIREVEDVADRTEREKQAAAYANNKVSRKVYVFDRNEVL